MRPKYIGPYWLASAFAFVLKNSYRKPALPFYIQDVEAVIAEHDGAFGRPKDATQVCILRLRKGRFACVHVRLDGFDCESCGGVWHPIKVRLTTASNLWKLVLFALTSEERELLGLDLRRL